MQDIAQKNVAYTDFPTTSSLKMNHNVIKTFNWFQEFLFYFWFEEFLDQKAEKQMIKVDFGKFSNQSRIVLDIHWRYIMVPTLV